MPKIWQWSMVKQTNRLFKPIRLVKLVLTY